LVQNINIQQYWTNHKSSPLFDVRTPSEYQKGHIPTAVNLPIFSDEERAVVGTIYKQKNPQEALLKGLELVGPKLRSIIEQVKSHTETTAVSVHCWRGGKRSGSIAWLLGMAGYQVTSLQGGYKAYRTQVLENLTNPLPQLIVLGGKTGCGKTKILKALAEQGEQIIDLEGLANHKGSAFGDIGQSEQPSTEQFENNLYEHIRGLDKNKRIWIENESKGIGKIFLPNPFWAQMKAAPLVNIELPDKERLAFLIKEYTVGDIAALKTGFHKIKKRLGGKRYQEAIDLLEQKEVAAAARIALQYYDKSYQYMLNKNTAPTIHKLQFSKLDPKQIAQKLINKTWNTN